MAKRVQLIRHVSAAALAFVGKVGEITVDLTRKSLRVHDGVTPGGKETANADLANVANASASTAGKMTTAQVNQLATNTSDIAVLQATDITHTAGIAANAADIATNTADIATNTADIATNTSDIAALDAALTPVVAANVAAIAGLAASVDYSLIDIQYFTANDTWNKPTGCDAAHVICIGAGGGGGYAKMNISPAATAFSTGTGGGAGGYSEAFITAGLGATESVVVGTGGAGGIAATSTPATAGGASSFGAHVDADGGNPGSGYTATNANPISFPLSAGSGGNAGAGDFGLTGEAGNNGRDSIAVINLSSSVAEIIASCPRGGEAPRGFSKSSSAGLIIETGTTGSTSGSTGTGYGGGGSGAVAASVNATSTQAVNGGAGRLGIVIVAAYKKANT